MSDLPNDDLHIVQLIKRNLNDENKRELLELIATNEFEDGINKAEILTAMAKADGYHDQVNQGEWDSHLSCRSIFFNNSGDIEDNLLKGLFGNPTEEQQNESSPNPKFKHNLDIILNTYMVERIGTDIEYSDWKNDDPNVRADSRREGYEKLKNNFNLFIQNNLDSSIKNIIYHYDAFFFNPIYFKNFLKPNGKEAFLIQTRASLTDPAQKITPESNSSLFNTDNDNFWKFIREKKSASLESHIYDKIKCENDSIERIKDTLVSDYKVTNVLSDYNEAYLKIEKETPRGSLKIYFDKNISSKHADDNDIKHYNMSRHLNSVNEIISGSHALAKRCGDWLQAIQTTKSYKENEYEIYDDSTKKYTDIASTSNFDFKESIHCLLTHDKILKSYALTIGVPMLIFSVPSRSSDDTSPGLEVYIKNSYINENAAILNKRNLLVNKIEYLIDYVNKKNNDVENQLFILKDKAKQFIYSINQQIRIIKENIYFDDIFHLNQEQLKTKLELGPEHFYLLFIRSISILFDALHTYGDTVEEIIKLDNMFPSSANNEVNDTQQENNYSTIELSLKQYDNDNYGKCQSIMAFKLSEDPDFEQIEKYIEELEELKRFVDFLNDKYISDRFIHLQNNGCKIFNNDFREEYASPISFIMNTQGSIISVTQLTTSIPSRLCLSYVRKLTFIDDKIKQIKKIIETEKKDNEDIFKDFMFLELPTKDETIFYFIKEFTSEQDLGYLEKGFFNTLFKDDNGREFSPRYKAKYIPYIKFLNRIVYDTYPLDKQTSQPPPQPPSSQQQNCLIIREERK